MLELATEATGAVDRVPLSSLFFRFLCVETIISYMDTVSLPSSSSTWSHTTVPVSNKQRNNRLDRARKRVVAASTGHPDWLTAGNDDDSLPVS